MLQIENTRLISELNSLKGMGVATPIRSSSPSPHNVGEEQTEEAEIPVVLDKEVGGGDSGTDAMWLSTYHRPKKTNLNTKQIHNRNIQVTKTSSFIAAKAAVIGISPENAAVIGKLAAQSIAKSYSQAAGDLVSTESRYE